MPSWLERHERVVVAVLCAAGALRVLVFSAAFPPFHPIDEPFHFDLVVKYSSGHVPHHLGSERFSRETKEAIVLYGTGISQPRPDLVLLHNSPEYLNPAPLEGVAPPVWTAPAAMRQAVLPWGTGRWDVVNYEATEPPVYYGLAGAWYRLGKALGLPGGHQFYWTRALNGALFAGVVWLSYLFARDFYPGNRFLGVGVPLLVAAFPQDSFYGVTNDAPLAPLLFAAALLCLLRISLSERPWPHYGLAGLLVAATLLTKYSNVAILAALLIPGLAAMRRPSVTRSLDHAGKLVVLVLAVLVPLAAWFTRNYVLSGDATGSYQRYTALGWSLKGFGAIWDHPFFGPSGPVALVQPFGQGVLATLWRGEIPWHKAPMALPSIDRFYAVSSAVLLAFAVIRLCGARERAERIATLTSAATVVFAVASLAALSTLFDFGDRTQHPTRDRPYFTSGRLIVGVLVPFVTLYLYGLEWGLARARLRGLALPVLGALAILITASQLVLAAGPFRSAYNWFQLPWHALR
jgi:hypothetical protein